MNDRETDYKTYVENTALLMGLTLTPEYLPGVVENLARVADVAALVIEFELSEDVEIAPVFEP